MVTTVTKPDRMKEVANEAIDAVEEKAFEGLESTREAVVNATDKVHQVETDIQQSIEQTTDKVTRYIKEKPLQAAGIAFAAGVLTTLILLRR